MAGPRRLLTPIAKAFGTDIGCEVASLAMQVFGGMGYIEETGVAQYWRDVRVTAIYEGTNGIQAMDLVGRKLADGGAAARALVSRSRATAGRGDPRLASAARHLADATGWMRPPSPTTASPAPSPTSAPSPLTLGGHYLAKAAAADPRHAALADFHLGRLLPEVAALCDAARTGAGAVYAATAVR